MRGSTIQTVVSGKKNDHRRTRTCNLLVPLAIEAKRATIAPGSLDGTYRRNINDASDYGPQPCAKPHSWLYLSFHDHDKRRSTSASAMALNWTMLNPDRTPVPLSKELTITIVESGAELSLIIPDAPPTGSSTSGGSGGGRNLNGTGKLFLTDQRVRFPKPILFLRNSYGTRIPS